MKRFEIASKLREAKNKKDWEAVQSILDSIDPDPETLSYPNIHCISCGKLMTTEIASYGNVQGTSFSLTFGYGSRFDQISGIVGHICDDCVLPKSKQLLWRKKPSPVMSHEVYLSTRNMRPLEEHPNMTYWFAPKKYLQLLDSTESDD